MSIAPIGPIGTLTPIAPMSYVTAPDVPDIVPFTYRDGETYLSILHNLEGWINKTLVPWINMTDAAFEESVQTIMNGIIDQINAAFADQTTDINNVIGQLNGLIEQVNTSVSSAAQDASNAAQSSASATASATAANQAAADSKQQVVLATAQANDAAADAAAAATAQKAAEQAAAAAATSNGVQVVTSTTVDTPRPIGDMPVIWLAESGTPVNAQAQDIVIPANSNPGFASTGSGIYLNATSPMQVKAPQGLIGSSLPLQIIGARGFLRVTGALKGPYVGTAAGVPIPGPSQPHFSENVGTGKFSESYPYMVPPIVVNDPQPSQTVTLNIPTPGFYTIHVDSMDSSISFPVVSVAIKQKHYSSFGTSTAMCSDLAQQGDAFNICSMLASSGVSATKERIAYNKIDPNNNQSFTWPQALATVIGEIFNQGINIFLDLELPPYPSNASPVSYGETVGSELAFIANSMTPSYEANNFIVGDEWSTNGPAGAQDGASFAAFLSGVHLLAPKTVSIWASGAPAENIAFWTAFEKANGFNYCTGAFMVERSKNAYNFINTSLPAFEAATSANVEYSIQILPGAGLNSYDSDYAIFEYNNSTTLMDYVLACQAGSLKGCQTVFSDIAIPQTNDDPSTQNNLWSSRLENPQVDAYQPSLFVWELINLINRTAGYGSPVVFTPVALGFFIYQYQGTKRLWVLNASNNQYGNGIIADNVALGTQDAGDLTNQQCDLQLSTPAANGVTIYREGVSYGNMGFSSTASEANIGLSVGYRYSYMTEN